MNMNMYKTIEADIKNGRIKGPESRKIPPEAHVLITLLPSKSKRHPDWSAIEPLLGSLKIREDAVEWQRKIRSDWD